MWKYFSQSHLIHLCRSKRNWTLFNFSFCPCSRNWTLPVQSLHPFSLPFVFSSSHSSIPFYSWVLATVAMLSGIGNYGRFPSIQWIRAILHTLCALGNNFFMYHFLLFSGFLQFTLFSSTGTLTALQWLD